MSGIGFGLPWRTHTCPLSSEMGERSQCGIFQTKIVEHLLPVSAVDCQCEAGVSIILIRDISNRTVDSAENTACGER